VPQNPSAMQTNKDDSPIKIKWELVNTPNSDQLFQKVIELILRELEQTLAPEGFDKTAPTGHAESVPVENNNQSQPINS
jgi:hypothetical protein